MKKFIPVNEPLFQGNEKKYLNECIDTGWISSEGPFVKKFESEFSKKVGRKFGIAVCNGTAAIDVAIESLGIGKGDEVILPCFTIISCVLQIVRSGARPIFIDADPYTWNMKINEIESKVTEKTKAIMIVHIYGLPVDIDPILKICSKYNLKLIEDAAEMIGQTYNGKSCGSFGDLSTVSFYPNKHITTGEGGMILTDNEKIAEKCRELRNLCFIPEKRFVHEHFGWNYRMTNLQAAVGMAQLEQLNYFIEKKRWIGNYYHTLLEDLDGIQLPLKETSFSKNIYWVFGVILSKEYGFSKFFCDKLKDYGIGTRPFFYPLSKQPILKSKGLNFKGHYKVSENLYNQGFYLPSGLSLKKEDIEYVVEKFKKVLNEIKN